MADTRSRHNLPSSDLVVELDMVSMSGKSKARKASFIAFGVVALAALSCTAETDIAVSVTGCSFPFGARANEPSQANTPAVLNVDANEAFDSAAEGTLYTYLVYACLQ